MTKKQLLERLKTRRLCRVKDLTNAVKSENQDDIKYFEGRFGGIEFGIEMLIDSYNMQEFYQIIDKNLQVLEVDDFNEEGFAKSLQFIIKEMDRGVNK